MPSAAEPDNGGPGAGNGPSLDRDGDVWRGAFPGLGNVWVHPDGVIEVEVEDAAGLLSQEQANRERALRFGWGEPLSFARRGLRCAGGAAVVPPTDDACLLLVGAPHDATNILIELTDRGWSVMGDRITPTEWQDAALVAHPRLAPLLASRPRAEKADLEGVPVRENTDSVLVDLPRTSESRPVIAVLTLQMRKPGEDALTVLTGHERFEAAASLMVGGALSPFVPGDANTSEDSAESEPVPRTALDEHLRLTALPYARLRLDSTTVTTDVDALVAWWRAMTEPAAEAEG